MSSWINRIFRSPTKQTPPPVVDPVLGELLFSEHWRFWTATVPISGNTVDFALAGDDAAPNEAVLAHAHDLVRDFPSFQRVIAEFLGKEALEYPSHSDEIRRLRIGFIGLTFSDRPRDGEIGFAGPGDAGVWRCCYIDGKPVTLGLDD